MQHIYLDERCVEIFTRFNDKEAFPWSSHLDVVLQSAVPVESRDSERSCDDQAVTYAKTISR